MKFTCGVSATITVDDADTTLCSDECTFLENDDTTYHLACMLFGASEPLEMVQSRIGGDRPGGMSHTNVHYKRHPECISAVAELLKQETGAANQTEGA